MHDIRRLLEIVEHGRTSGFLIEQSGAFDADLTAAAAELIANIDWSGGGGVRVLAEMGYDPENADDVDTASPAFRAALLDWAEDRCAEALTTIEYLFHKQGGTLTVWRVITAPADWTPDPGRHPGVFWSWDKTAAEAHWGSFGAGDVEWLLRARARPEDIAWTDTLAANALPDQEDEKEIRFRDGVPVRFTYRRR